MAIELLVHQAMDLINSMNPLGFDLPEQLEASLRLDIGSFLTDAHTISKIFRNKAENELPCQCELSLGLKRLSDKVQNLVPNYKAQIELLTMQHDVEMARRDQLRRQVWKRHRQENPDDMLVANFTPEMIPHLCGSHKRRRLAISADSDDSSELEQEQQKEPEPKKDPKA